MKTIIFVLFVLFNQTLMSQEKTSKMLEIIFEGEYVTGTSPGIYNPDGSKYWFLTTGFNVIKVIKGNVKVAYIEIDNYDGNQYKIKLQENQTYIVTIKLSKERIKETGIDTPKNTMMPLWNSINKNEIIKIEKQE